MKFTCLAQEHKVFVHGQPRAQIQTTQHKGKHTNDGAIVPPKPKSLEA